MDLALEDNIVHVLDGEPLGEVVNGNGSSSERTLRQVPTTDHHSLHLSCVKEVELVSYLTYNHPTKPYPPP